jgi:hypothetical protein
VPQRAQAEDSRAQAAPQAGAAADHWCSTIPPGFGHPPLNVTPVTLQVLQRSVEPVPATDGLIHLGYAALVFNYSAQPVQIVSVVPVDPLAGFSPTGRNLITDELGRDVAGKVKLAPQDITAPGPEVPGPVSAFSTQLSAGSARLMFFDVTYTAPDQCQACSPTRSRSPRPPAAERPSSPTRCRWAA